MDLNLINTVWEELKRYINVVDRNEAAENFVGILVDNDFDPEDIKTEFAGDSNIKRALSNYINQDKHTEEEDTSEYDEDEMEDWDE